jgi:CheY-like chemotaxis protein
MPDLSPCLLIVEDDPNDVFFVKRALQKAALNFEIRVVGNGEQAIDYLSGQGTFQEREKFPVPRAMLLDLKTPFVNGFQVLEWLRSRPAFSQMKVFVLTGSSLERDREKALGLGANGYIVKPPTPELLSQTLAPFHRNG